jgi:cell wall-associated NlpC family hydrolase
MNAFRFTDSARPKGIDSKPCLIILPITLAFLYGCSLKTIKGYGPETRARSEVVQQAVLLLGKPYKSGAKGPEAFDCSGFVNYIYLKIGKNLPSMTEGLMSYGAPISGDSIQAGDLVFFKNNKEFHVGIMINNKEFIHASTTRGVVIDDISTSYWRKSLFGFRTIP